MARSNIILLWWRKASDGTRLTHTATPICAAPTWTLSPPMASVFRRPSRRRSRPAPARATLLTGLYPHAHRAFADRDPIAAPSLPGLLRGAGYHTAGIGVLPPCLVAADASFEVVRPLTTEEGLANRGASYAGVAARQRRGCLPAAARGEGPPRHVDRRPCDSLRATGRRALLSLRELSKPIRKRGSSIPLGTRQITPRTSHCPKAGVGPSRRPMRRGCVTSVSSRASARNRHFGVSWPPMTLR